MRKVELELDNLDDYVEGKTTGGFDWKADAETVLESVDEVLKERGLEIVTVDTGDDTFLFYIAKRGISSDTTAELAGDRIDWGADR